MRVARCDYDLATAPATTVVTARASARGDAHSAARGTRVRGCASTHGQIAARTSVALADGDDNVAAMSE